MTIIEVYGPEESSQAWEETLVKVGIPSYLEEMREEWVLIKGGTIGGGTEEGDRFVRYRLFKVYGQNIEIAKKIAHLLSPHLPKGVDIVVLSSIAQVVRGTKKEY